MYEVSINGDFGKSKKSSIKNFFAQNKLLVFLSICLLLGVFCGSMMVKFSDKNTLKLINILFSNELKDHTSKPLLEFFICSLSSTFIFIVASFFMGLSMYGFTCATFIPFLRGICIGMSEVYLYSSYGLKGLFLHLLMFLPGIFSSTVVLLLATQEAICMSNKLSALAFSKKNIDVSFELKRYFARGGCIAILSIISTIIDLTANVLSMKINII